MELVKPIIALGNSAGVIVPRAWLHGTARIELVRAPVRPEAEVFAILQPYLSQIRGIYLVGSYARGEETRESDVDVLVLTSSLTKRITQGKYEIILVSEETLQKTLATNALPFVPMLREGKPLLNASLLTKYQETPLTQQNLSWHFETTASALALVQASIALAEEQGTLCSDTEAYSLVLRLREVSLVDCLLQGKKYRAKRFLRLLDSPSAYKGYGRVKRAEPLQRTLPVQEAYRLHVLILKRLEEQKQWIRTQKH